MEKKSISTYRRPNIRQKQKIEESSSDDDDDEKIEEIPKSLEPQSFPKAIVYPDAEKEKKIEVVKAAEQTGPLTFSKVFEDIAKKRNRKKPHSFLKVTDCKFSSTFLKNDETGETITVSDTEDTWDSPELPITEKETTELVPDSSNNDNSINTTMDNSSVIQENISEIILDSPKKEEDDEIFEAVPVDFPSFKKQKVKYLIPQNLLRSATDKVASISGEDSETTEEEENMDEYLFEVVNDDNPSLQSSQPISGFSTFPLRPEINCTLIDNVANYRVIAQYLMKMKNIPSIDFESTDVNEFINVYRSLKR